jgi:hypothetical protein
MMGVAVATFTRQYLVFVPVAICAASILAHDRRAALRMVAATCAGVLPLVAMIMYWGAQLSPPNAVTAMYVPENVNFDGGAAALYLSAPALYLLPLVVWTLLRLRDSRPIWVGLLVALFVLLNPIHASTAQLRDGIATVGFLHRALTTAMPHPSVTHACFVVLGFVWGTVMAIWLAEFRETPSSQRSQFDVFLWFVILSFYIVMPFSFIPWEKYLLPLFVAGIVLDGRRLAGEFPRGITRRERGLRGETGLHGLHGSMLCARLRSGNEVSAGAARRSACCAGFRPARPGRSVIRVIRAILMTPPRQSRVRHDFTDKVLI